MLPPAEDQRAHRVWRFSTNPGNFERREERLPVLLFFQVSQYATLKCTRYVRLLLVERRVGS